ncbi:hypothetical protein AB6A40_003976 [Gnathostoma spinigerum]|uniref:Phosphatidylinositol 3-kinase catalytic subunit type 3 n=1 Tax=Gnathostoma spinigerum TaxID=75299 RepID=A0ABD6EKP3_9BILA
MNDSEHSTGGDTNASVAASVSNTSNDLASFLIQSGCQDPVIANYLYWYLTVEIEATASIDSSKLSNEYKRIRARLQKALQMAGGEARQRENSIRMQKKLVETLVSMTKLVSQETGGRTQKEKALRKAIREHSDLKDMPGLCLPVDPLVKVKAIVPEATMVFNSTRMPIKLCFETETNERYTTVFKSGDDLRQDQLVVQMIRIMDRLLRREGLDLRLTPYSVLATSPNDGFIEFVKSTPLTSVMSNWSSIQEFLRSFRPSPNSRYGIEHEVLENYVRSCAGYSIICYILGIGDRHLNNLLLCESGRLFHIDFGFFLGRDPKPLPPPMKLTTEMVNAMGGLDSKEWKDFRGFCFSAFNILRRHANLILNLFSLMLDAGIPDIAIEKDKAVQKVEQRFHLEMTEEMADQHIQMLIDESVNAKMPIIVDLVHNFTQYMRN